MKTFKTFLSGQIVAQSGQGFNSNVYAALTSSLWETFDRQGNRDRLKEIEVRGENSNILASRVANMVIAMISEPNVPLAICKAKLNQLVAHLGVLHEFS
jgi:predicted regulator of Ras-like GTPase activity (Roadblock/LC7/MglB family)